MPVESVRIRATSDNPDSGGLLVALSGDEDVVLLQYVVSFRVLKGTADLFGAFYAPQNTFETIVIPPWIGHYRLTLGKEVCAEKTSDLAPTEFSGTDVEHGFLLLNSPANGLHDPSYQASAINSEIKRLSSSYRLIVLFRDVQTAFGTCKAQYAVSFTPVFNRMILDKRPDWAEPCARIVDETLKRAGFGFGPLPSNATEVKNEGVRTLVIGAKGVGKSFFCCHLINSLLTVFDKVALLDTDLGQPILGVPGTVSLNIVYRPLLGDLHSLGESFDNPLHVISPRAKEVLSVFGGGFSPESNPRLYLAGVGQCALKYQQLVAGALELSETVKAHTLMADPAASMEVDCRLLSPVVHASSGLRERRTLPQRLLAYLRSDVPVEAPEKIVEKMAQFLCQSARQKGPNKSPLIPLVVNTHGWVTGLGWQLIDAIGALTWASSAIELNAPDSADDCQIPRVSSPGERGETVLQLPSPFEDLVLKFCGHLPLPWSSLDTTQIVQVTGAFTPPTKSSTTDVSPADKRWLKLMAHFNPAYRCAVHFPAATNEEFFHGMLSASTIRNRIINRASQPRLVAVRLWDAVQPGVSNKKPRPRFQFSCPGQHPMANRNFFAEDKLSVTEPVSDVLFALTGSLVALCRSDVSNQISPESAPEGIWVEPCAWKFLSYAWVHSVDILNGEIYMYVPPHLGVDALAKANVLQLGYRVEFSPLPDTIRHLGGAFPTSITLKSAKRRIVTSSIAERSPSGTCLVSPAQYKANRGVGSALGKRKTRRGSGNRVTQLQTQSSDAASQATHNPITPLTAAVLRTLSSNASHPSAILVSEGSLKSQFVAPFECESVFKSIKGGVAGRSKRTILPRFCQRRTAHSGGQKN